MRRPPIYHDGMMHNELLEYLKTEEITLVEFTNNVKLTMGLEKFKKFDPEFWDRQFIKERNVGLLMYEYINEHGRWQLGNIAWKRINNCDIIISNNDKLIEEVKRICGSLKNAFA